ncbi:MAG: hypothetical protein [Microviridae sp.]|nr:MAG: hypothetical protein [Microviridae sp.]
MPKCASAHSRFGLRGRRQEGGASCSYRVSSAGNASATTSWIGSGDALPNTTLRWLLTWSRWIIRRRRGRTLRPPKRSCMETCRNG